MTTVPNSDACVDNLGESLTDARRLRELLAGASALLMDGQGTSTRALNAARGTLLEAKAVSDGVIDRLEAFVGWKAEQERVHAGQLGKSISVPEVVR